MYKTVVSVQVLEETAAATPTTGAKAARDWATVVSHCLEMQELATLNHPSPVVALAVGLVILIIVALAPGLTDLCKKDSMVFEAG